MTPNDIKYYIDSRNGELSADEILYVIDISRNEQIDHIVYENGIWNVWDKNGNYYTFVKRNW